MVVILYLAAQLPGGLVPTQAAGPQLQSFWFCRFGMELRICIPNKFQGDNWCCWIRDHTLRTTSLASISLIIHNQRTIRTYVNWVPEDTISYPLNPTVQLPSLWVTTKLPGHTLRTTNLLNHANYLFPCSLLWALAFFLLLKPAKAPTSALWFLWLMLGNLS